MTLWQYDSVSEGVTDVSLTNVVSALYCQHRVKQIPYYVLLMFRISYFRLIWKHLKYDIQSPVWYVLSVSDNEWKELWKSKLEYLWKNEKFLDIFFIFVFTFVTLINDQVNNTSSNSKFMVYSHRNSTIPPWLILCNVINIIIAILRIYQTICSFCNIFCCH